MKLLLLEDWAARHYGSKPPPLYSLRKWARNGEFWPPASKDGKHWYVYENAKRLSHHGAEMELVDRITA